MPRGGDHGIHPPHVRRNRRKEKNVVTGHGAMEAERGKKKQKKLQKEGDAFVVSNLF